MCVFLCRLFTMTTQVFVFFAFLFTFFKKDIIFDVFSVYFPSVSCLLRPSLFATLSRATARQRRLRDRESLIFTTESEWRRTKLNGDTAPGLPPPLLRF